MPKLTIAISRHEAALYEWAVLFADDPVDQDVGATSINECLSDSIDAIPKDILLVEVSYCGVHMGTFRRAEIDHQSELVAKQITERYGVLLA